MTQNPVTFTDVVSQTNFPTQAQMAGRDVKIVMSTTTTNTAQATIQGTEANPVRNVWLVGGNWDVDTFNGGVITGRWFSGTIFIEGVDIDANNNEQDAIRFHTPIGTASRVVIQNSRVRGMGFGTIHGDAIHGQESPDQAQFTAELKVQNFRAECIRQGIFMPWRDGNTEGFLVHGARKIVMDHVELVLDARFQWDPPSGSIATIYFAGPEVPGSVNLFPPDGQAFNDVWMNWWDPHVPTQESRLNATVPLAESYDVNDFVQLSAQDIADAQFTWPIGEAGPWRKGNPPATFVPLDKIGLNYDRSFFTGG